MYEVNKTIKMISGLFLAAGIQGAAQAMVYDIVSVLRGSDGFGASSFHDASGSNVMSGPMVADIVEGLGLFGTYNDVTGELNATGLMIAGGGTFSLNGTLLFDASGLLAANSVLNISFSGTSNPALTDTTIGFLPGDVCCSGFYDPNSFRPYQDKMIMTLWGADFMGDFLNTGRYDYAELGMDLRMKMIERVPEPSVLAMLAIGLLGLGSRRFVARRQGA